MFELIKRYYNAGIYTLANVATFVKIGKLMSDEYKSVIGKKYTA